MAKLRAIQVVYADWCPHCVPTTLEPAKAAAARLGVKLELLDIDTDEVKKADMLVKKYGDWTEDYLVPQVFLEYDDATVRHLFTGDPRGVSLTRAGVTKALDGIETS